MGDRNRSRRVYSFYRAPPAPATDGTTIIINGGGVTQSQLTGIWIDSGSLAGMKTTGSISIDSNFPTPGGRNATDVGTDVYFFVSGSNGIATGANRHVAVLPDIVMSGSSLKMNGTREVVSDTAAGYTIFGSQAATQLVGTNEVFINNGAGGGYIILRPSSAGTIYQDAATVTMRDASFLQAALLTVTGSRGVRWSGTTQPPVGTDTFFFVSGTNTAGAIPTSGKVAVLPDTYVSGGVSIGSSVTYANPGSGIEAFIGASNAFTRIWGSNNACNIIMNGGITQVGCSANNYTNFVNNAGQEQLRVQDHYDPAGDNWATIVVCPRGASFGTDVSFFVSGSIGAASGGNRRIAVFATDVIFSGSVNLPASTVLNTYVSGTWRDAGNKLVTTASVSIDLSNRTASTIGTDVFFFVSGSAAVGSGPNRKLSLFGGDVFISGSLCIGTGSMPSVTGSIAMPNGALIMSRATNGTLIYMAQTNTNNDFIVGGVTNSVNNYMAGTHSWYNTSAATLAVANRQLTLGDASAILGLANTATAYAISLQSNGLGSGSGDGPKLSIAAGNGNNNGAGGHLLLVGGQPSGNGQGTGRVALAPNSSLNVSSPTRIVLEAICSTNQDRHFVALHANGGALMVEGKMPQGTGNFVTYVGDATVIPNTSATGGAILYSVTGTLATRDATTELLLGKQICWGSGTIAPILTQGSSTLGNGQAMTVAAQPALSGTGNIGGNLILSGGAPGWVSTGRAGAVILASQTGSLEFTGLRCAVTSAAGVIGNPGPAYYMEVYYTSGSIQRFHGAVPIYTFAPLNSGSV